MKYLFRKNTHSGFSLIELMVVMTIIGILVGIAILNTGRNDDRDIRMEADRLVTFFRDVQNMALSADYISISGKKVCGYGTYYNSGTPDYFQPFFVTTEDIASTSEDALDVSCGSGDVSKKNDSGTGSSASDYTSQSSFYFKDGVVATDDDSGGSPSDIFFLIPEGRFYYDGNSGAEANLRLTKGSASIVITINNVGNISY